jgi:hypothetical protein
MGTPQIKTPSLSRQGYFDVRKYINATHSQKREGYDDEK